MSRYLAIAIAVILLGGCQGRPGSSRAVAEAFLDAHYVRIDLEASRSLCSGLARDKVGREIALTSQVSIDADTHKPRINYRFGEARHSADRVQYVYELTVRAAGLEPFTKNVMVTVRASDGAWSVSNYAESDTAVGR